MNVICKFRGLARLSPIPEKQISALSKGQLSIVAERILSDNTEVGDSDTIARLTAARTGG